MFSSSGNTSQYQNLQGIFSSLYTSGKYADLTIKCQGREWRVHRNVVCSQSKPLAAAVDGNFKEAATGEIALDEDDPAIVQLMIYFLYHGYYQDGSGYIKGVTSLFTGTSSIFNPSPFQPSTSKLFGPTPAPTTPAAPSPAPSLFTNPPLPATSSNVFSNIAQPTSSNVFSRHPFSSNTTSNPTTCGPDSLFKRIGNTTSSPTPTSRGLFDGTVGSTAQSSSSSRFTTCIQPEALVTNAKVYIMAEQYDIQPLKIFAKGKYQEILPAAWNSASFVESLRLIYDGTPEGSTVDMLRLVATKAATENAKALMDRQDFQELCQERGDITSDVLRLALVWGSGPSANTNSL